MYKINTQIFIARSSKIHSNRYDYSKVIYINGSTKVIINCKIHGDFVQTPYNHLSGRGCMKCGRRARMNTREFIQKALLAHGNEYDYSKVEYINARSKIIIICKKHGEFLQLAKGHLQGNKCKKCTTNTYAERMANREINTVEFIKKACKIHKGKYCYSKSEYINNNVEITIICNIHGEFKRRPRDHLIGYGCAKCKYGIDLYEEIIDGHCYINYLNNTIKKMTT